MNTMFTFVYLKLYDKKNGYQQDNSWYVYIHTENALKRMRKLQFWVIIFHDDQISHLIF